MKHKKLLLYFFTFTALAISIILSFATPESKAEERSLIFMISFLITAICISASLTFFTVSLFGKYIDKFLIALLSAILSCWIYIRLFFFVLGDIGGGESGLIFQSYFGVGIGIVVGIISLIINVIILVRYKVEEQPYNKAAQEDIQG